MKCHTIPRWHMSVIAQEEPLLGPLGKGAARMRAKQLEQAIRQQRGETIPSTREDGQPLFATYLAEANPAVLCELASASYYLDVKPLVDLTCRAIADTIKGKSPEEIRSTFNIVNDFTPAEEEHVRRSVLERTLLLPGELLCGVILLIQFQCFLTENCSLFTESSLFIFGS